MKKLLILLIGVLVCTQVWGANEYVTTNYEFVVPEEGSRDWTHFLSNDIISIDNILSFVSSDSVFVDTGTTITQRTTSDKIKLGSTNTAREQLDVDGNTSMTGVLSADSGAWISQDVNVGGRLSVDGHIVVSAETSTTGLTATDLVGRIEILSSDGVTKCYIPIYLGG